MRHQGRVVGERSHPRSAVTTKERGGYGEYFSSS